MIRTKTTLVNAEGDEHTLCAVKIKGDHRDVMQEYVSTVEGITRGILLGVPDSLQSAVKQDMKLELMRMCLEIL